MADASNLTCPLCGETDFDDLGLVLHFDRDWCDAAKAIRARGEKADG